MHTITINGERVMNLKENREGCMGGLGRQKGTGEMGGSDGWWANMSAQWVKVFAMQA